jgi:plastocyanin
MKIQSVLIVATLVLGTFIAVTHGAMDALADDARIIKVEIQDHTFTPDRIEVAAGETFILEVSNRDPLPEEFESMALHIEKVIAGHTDGKIRINGLEAGEYAFIGEFHADQANGVIVVK